MRKSWSREARRDSAAPEPHIEVGTDWRRCGAGDGGCGVLLPLSQQTCPRCGRTNREDLAPLGVRRLLADGDPYGRLPDLVVILPGAARHPGGDPPEDTPGQPGATRVANSSEGVVG